MNRDNWAVAVYDFYRLWASRCSAPLPRDLDPSNRLEGHTVRVDNNRVETLCGKIDEVADRYRLPVDWLAAVTCEAGAAQPLCCGTLSSIDMMQGNAQAAVLLAFTIGRSEGVVLPAAANVELVEVLLATYMTWDQRRDVVRAIYSSQVRSVLSERERPDPTGGPIISLGTPVSSVTRAQQLASLAIADALADVIMEAGWQADIPGHHISPDIPREGRAQVAREHTSRSSLAYAGALVGVDSHLARRGLGYAVARAESSAAAVLLLPAELEPSGFARVFRDRFAHREEGVYADVVDAQSHLRAFLRDHSACIMQRHERILRYRVRLEDLSKQLTRRLATVDLGAVAVNALTPAQADFLASDPIHLGQALPWELEQLARLVGMSAELLRKLVLWDAQGLPSASASAVARGSRSTANDSRLRLEYTAFAAARQLHPAEPARWLQLWDEHMGHAVAGGTAARRGRTDAMDWISVYHRRFG